MNQAFQFSKSLLRQALRTNLSRDDHDQSELQQKQHELSQRLAKFLKSQTGTWATFEPVGFEPDIREAVSNATHLKWVYPRVEGDSLKFYAISSRTDLVENQWKILEPNPTRATLVSPSDLSGLLIPGLAFDETCNRLGRGRGYYDRTLSEFKNFKTQPQKVGIALDRQVSKDSLPLDPHDIAMDRVITESRVLERTSP